MADIVEERREIAEFLKQQALDFESGNSVAMLAVVLSKDGRVAIVKTIHGEDTTDAFKLIFWGECAVSGYKAEVLEALTK